LRVVGLDVIKCEAQRRDLSVAQLLRESTSVL
jgi:hypothetical protein